MANNQPRERAVATAVEDEMSVAETIDEGVEVGHAGLPVFWMVGVGLVLLWALIAWKPWGGY